MTKTFITDYADYISGEVWAVAVGYQYYLVSNYGRVYSLKHKKILKYNVVTRNYLEVKLKRNDGRFEHVKVHRLVAKMFIDNPQGKTIVHHIDCNNQNNRADNLMWVTAEEHKQIHRQLREAAKQSRQQKGGDVNE